MVLGTGGLNELCQRLLLKVFRNIYLGKWVETYTSSLSPVEVESWNIFSSYYCCTPIFFFFPIITILSYLSFIGNRYFDVDTQTSWPLWYNWVNTLLYISKLVSFNTFPCPCPFPRPLSLSAVLQNAPSKSNWWHATECWRNRKKWPKFDLRT